MMIRPFTLFCVFFAGVSGMVLYAQKHKTTQLDRQITKIVIDTQRIKSNTSMLRTEWTLLNQPDRLKDLASNSLPTLHPLNPTQFVQMSAAASALPPIKQDPEKDKIRENLVQNVAQNHGQTPSVATDQTKENEEPPIIIAANNDATIASDSKPRIIPPAVLTDSKDNVEQPNAPPPPVHHKKIKAIANADITNTIETQDLKPQTIKKPTPTIAKNTTSSDAMVTPPVHHKKAKVIEVADATDSIETQNLKPQAIKKNHIENVSYNIQSGNPFSHKKANGSKPISSIQDDTAILNKKTTKKTLENTPQKHSTSIKVAHYDTKKNAYSESALGGNSDESLPAPVPFAQ